VGARRLYRSLAEALRSLSRGRDPHLHATDPGGAGVPPPQWHCAQVGGWWVFSGWVGDRWVTGG
jgi:hypothetical protein